MNTNNSSTQILEVAARWYVFAMISVYGLGKMLGGQFYRHGHLPPEVAGKTVAELGAFELAWTFFGYSQAYILFIGISQVAGSAMLLWERSKLLGVAVLMPILLNIIVVDALYDIQDAMMSAIFYLLLLLLILFFNREKVMAAIRELSRINLKPGEAGQHRLLKAGMVIGALVVMFFAETFLLKIVGFSRL